MLSAILLHCSWTSSALVHYVITGLHSDVNVSFKDAKDTLHIKWIHTCVRSLSIIGTKLLSSAYFQSVVYTVVIVGFHHLTASPRRLGWGCSAASTYNSALLVKSHIMAFFMAFLFTSLLMTCNANALQRKCPANPWQTTALGSLWV